MAKEKQEIINEAYEHTKDVYDWMLDIVKFGSTLSNIGVLSLAICGILKTQNRLSMFLFVGTLIFYIIENNLGIYKSLKFYDKTLDWYEQIKKNVGNIELLPQPKQNWKLYCFSVTIEIVLIVAGYIVM